MFFDSLRPVMKPASRNSAICCERPVLPDAERVLQVADRALAIDERADDHQPRRVGELLEEVRRLSGTLDHLGRIGSKIELHWSSHGAPWSASSGIFR